MKTVDLISAAEHFTAANVGTFDKLGEYVLELSPETRIPGKVFGGQVVGTNGSDFSFQSFAPGTETGFLHTHKRHEELYFFLSGQGEFQVDSQVFPVSQGTVVRVAPEGRRSVRNNGTEPLVMLCIQYRALPFGEEDAQDATLLADPVEW